MKSQMELALTIGTVVIGAVLLISALVLSWELLLPATDACRIAAGIGYDVGAIQSVLFTVPGDINIHYIPPSICEFPYQMGISGFGLICQPLQGGNPNITSISTYYQNINKNYGFSHFAPLYLTVEIAFNWNNNLEHKIEKSNLKIKEIATTSPGLIGGEYLHSEQRYITISKYQTPYGDVISPLSFAQEDAIEKMVTAMISSAHNGKNYSSDYVQLPKNWFLGYNSNTNKLCEYRIISNSYIYDVNNYANFLNNAKDYIRNSFYGKFGFTDVDYSCSGENAKNSIVYYPNTPNLCLSYTNYYDPSDQFSVKRYGTGFLEVRCFNVSKITQDGSITSVKVDIENSQKLINGFNSSYRSVGNVIMYKYNASYKNGEVDLKVWKE